MSARTLPLAAKSGNLYRHEEGKLYRFVDLVASDPSHAPGVLCRAVDPRENPPLHVAPMALFEGLCKGDDLRRLRYRRLARASSDALEAALPDALIPGPLRQSILARYDERQRFYHDRFHVLEVFECAQRSGQPLLAEQSLALLYHDAIYVPGASTGENERLSALLARVDAWQFAPVIDLDCIVQIIEDTARHQASRPESALVLDLDLSPLATDPIRFLALNEMVWLENRHLLEGEDEPREAFDRRRLSFLQSLAQRGPLFSMLTELEEPARANIAALARA